MFVLKLSGIQIYITYIYILMSKIRVVRGEYIALKYIFIDLAVPNLMIFVFIRMPS